MIITNTEKFAKNVIDIRLRKYNSQNLFNALDKMFPDRWELQNRSSYIHYNWKGKINLEDILKNSKFHFRIIIHFPEITITNGRQKHKITDLYVSINAIVMKNYSNSYITINGSRGSFTLTEIKKRYSHSHLSTIQVGDSFDNFCLGSGPINYYLTQGLDRTEEEWLFFFNLLNQYLRWESIAGRPYNYINNLGLCNTLPVVEDYIVDQIFKYYKIRNIKHKITNTSIEVIPSDSMEEELTKLLKDDIYKHYLCYKNPNGEYLTKDQIKLDNNVSYYKDKELFTFKGELLKIKILDERTDEQDNYTINAPIPELTKKLCAKLSSSLTKAYIKRSRIKSENTSESTQEYSRKDEVLVL